MAGGYVELLVSVFVVVGHIIQFQLIWCPISDADITTEYLRVIICSLQLIQSSLIGI